jgi:methyl-accepting chemotaxis protein
VSTNATSDTAGESAREPARSLPGWRWFQDHRLGTKLSMAFLAVFAFTVAFGFGSITMLNVTAQMDRTVSLTKDVLSPMTETRRTQYEGALILRRMAMDPTDAQRSQEMQQLIANTAAMKLSMARVDSELTAPIAQWDEFKTTWNRWLPVRDSEIVPLARAGNVAAANAALRRLEEANTNAQVQEITAALGVVQGRIAATTADTNVARARYMQLLLIAFVLGVSLAGLLARSVIRETTLAVGALKRSLDAMAEGDLTVPAQARSRDEIGAMAHALTTAQEQLRAMLAKVAGTAGTVSAAAQELSASNVRVAEVSEESSAQAQAVAAASEEVSINVQSVAGGAEELSVSIRQIAENATEASAVAGQGVTFSNSTATTVSELGQSSKQIADFVKVITSIAGQTNLLALNATIEAVGQGRPARGLRWSPRRSKSWPGSRRGRPRTSPG